MSLLRVCVAAVRRGLPVAVLALGCLLAAPGTAQAAPRAALPAPAGPADLVAQTSSVEPRKVDLGYSLATTTLGDGRWVVLRWNPCQDITYRVNVAAVPVSRRPAVLQDTRRAVARLSQATGLTYRYAGQTSYVPNATTVAYQPAELVIAVTSAARTDYPIGGERGGYGGYRYWEWSRSTSSGLVRDAAIARGWVVLDAAGFLDLKPGFGKGSTRGNVLLHEIAHTTGLDHVQDADQLMYPKLAPDSPDGLAAGDLAGLRRLGAEAGCISVPAAVVDDLD